MTVKPREVLQPRTSAARLWATNLASWSLFLLSSGDDPNCGDGRRRSRGSVPVIGIPARSRWLLWILQGALITSWGTSREKRRTWEPGLAPGELLPPEVQADNDEREACRAGHLNGQ